ncbi:MAG: hypothetical protein SVK08_10340 [Halobacteriota archaeon]|nr:hypothetical protein [Halobacteriota archaeon]
MTEDVRRLNIHHLDDVWRVHSEAFQNDEPLLHILQYSREDLEKMNRFVDELFLCDGSYDVYGLFHDGDLVCISLCHRGNLTPKTRYSLKFLMGMLRDLGVIKSLRALKFFAILSMMSRYDSDCVRLVAIGASDSGRGGGCGTKMLRFLRNTFGDEGYRFIQLEVEEVNPAKGLYLREGFKVVNEFETCGVSWNVMVQAL